MAMTTSTDELFTAIDTGDETTVEALLATDPALAAARDVDGVSATLHALYRRRRRIAERLATALPALEVFEAAALGRSGRVGELVGADPAAARAMSPDGFTALHLAAYFAGGAGAETATILLGGGADPNAPSTNEMGVRPLHSAVSASNDAVVAALLEAGADVNAAQREGYTALHGAAHNGATAIVERLLAAGADRTARTDAGRTPADLAEAAGHPDLAARLR
jgi:ankyrin repeat protein